MANSWRVVLNKQRWDQEKYEESYHSQPEVRRLAQSKGMLRMKVVPKKGDSVRFVYNKRVVMKGIVDSDGFEYNPSAKAHSCNKGVHRPHTDSDEYAWIQIIEVGLFEYIRWTGQRTWALYTDDMGVETS